MRFKIFHLTEYTYSDNIFFEPHYVRLTPKHTAFSSLTNYSVKIEPEPIGFSDQIDTENNHIRLCWFEGSHNSLRINVESVIDVAEYNPFNFLIHPPEYLKLPFRYDEPTHQLLNPALQAGTLTKQMEMYLNDVLIRTKYQTIDFLTELTKQIHREFALKNREMGEPLEPCMTFAQRYGSCRDLSWMQIHFLRHLGIASRFVSGYFYLLSEKPEFELHAWIEVFIPGAGWIGFDPSHGIITTCYHIPLASSAFSENTMPVSGSIRGAASSELNFDLSISIIS